MLLQLKLIRRFFPSFILLLSQNLLYAIPPVALPQMEGNTVPDASEAPTPSDASPADGESDSTDFTNSSDSSDSDVGASLEVPPPLDPLPPLTPEQQELVAHPEKEFEPLISQKNKGTSSVIVRPYSKEQRKAEEAIDPNVTCTDLIQGTLDATGEGRANLVCEQAMERCLAQESIDKLIKDGKSPWSARDTKKLAVYVLRESIRWRRLCEAARLTTVDSQFLTEYFYRKKRKTPEQKRPLSRKERAFRKLQLKREELEEASQAEDTDDMEEDNQDNS